VKRQGVFDVAYLGSVGQFGLGQGDLVEIEEQLADGFVYAGLLQHVLEKAIDDKSKVRDERTGIPHMRPGLARYGMQMQRGRIAMNSRANCADGTPFPPSPLLWGIGDRLPSVFPCYLGSLPIGQPGPAPGNRSVMG
jgi:hypothetical protein